MSSAAETVLLRARAQHLTDGSTIAGNVHDVVAALGGIQAQSMPAAALAIRPRSRELVASDVALALNEERSVVRTWAMRGTLHLLAAEDVGWMTSLLGRIFAARAQRRRQQLGIDDSLAERALALIPKLLADGPRTRAELIAGMRKGGVAFEPRSQGPIHLIALAAMRGVLVYGPDREGDETFVLLEDWIGRQGPPSMDEAIRELARRYFAAHAPADAADFAAWSGLPIGVTREAAGAAPPPPPSRTEREGDASVRLLPAFDEYLLGWASRDFAFAPDLQRRLQRGGGWIHPAVIVDGRGAGAWRAERRGERLEVTVEAFEHISPAADAGIETEVADLGRYLGIRTGRRRAGGRRPLPRR